MMILLNGLKFGLNISTYRIILKAVNIKKPQSKLALKPIYGHLSVQERGLRLRFNLQLLRIVL